MKSAGGQFIIITIGIFILTFVALYMLNMTGVAPFVHNRQWDVQSVDTMKYSRDLAREKLSDKAFDAVIDQQMTAISKTGATHVGIGTPYDPEFLPMLNRWVSAARKHHLHVWFRGNFSGWEGWFGYAKMDGTTHTAKVKEFIENNSDLFENGDIFTSCPECENGAKVNYGNSVELASYRAFLLEEYRMTKEQFAMLNKNVTTNYYSMNMDVAKALMDKTTTAEFGGVVVVDHYVRDPDKLASDISELSDRTGGKVVLGEFGAPIPDINGQMTDAEQAAWLGQALEKLSTVAQLQGLNYWVNIGGSTAIWNADGSPKPAVKVLRKYYKIQDQNSQNQN